MTHISRWIICGLLLVPCVHAGSVRYFVTEVAADTANPAAAGPVNRFNYIFSDMNLQAYQEIEIRFDPTIFISVFNPLGGLSFDVLSLQVNNPVGAWGIYSIMALENSPPFAGPFSIDAVLRGPAPATLPYNVNQIDPETFAVQMISSGIAYNAAAVPEPSSFAYVVIACLAGGYALRRGGRSRSAG